MKTILKKEGVDVDVWKGLVDKCIDSQISVFVQAMGALEAYIYRKINRSGAKNDTDVWVSFLHHDAGYWATETELFDRVVAIELQ